MIWLIPVISALIGWFTNYLAVKMLFHPREEIDFKLFKLQGVFPKRKPYIAQKLGEIVARDLFTTEQIKSAFDSPEIKEEIQIAIDTEVEQYLRQKVASLNPLVAKMIGENTIMQAKSLICSEILSLLPKFTDKFAAKIDQIDIQQTVAKRVEVFSDEKLEQMIFSVMRTELKFIEISGAVLGFLIGVVQLILTLMFN